MADGEPWATVGYFIVRGAGIRSHRYPLETRNRVLVLYHTSYSDYGPTLFGEVLQEQYGLRIHAETLRRWLRSAGLWRPEEQGRRHRAHRRARPRRQAVGSLLQLDGSPHDWFEGRNPDLPEVTLLVGIDDASNRVLLRFRPSEDTQGVFELLESYFHQYGLPQAIYTDHGRVYWTEDGTTQYQRAMQELGIETIDAHSPQAKGRVERSNRTFQDRLITAMRQQGIRTIEEANRFLEAGYTQRHHSRFAHGTGLEDVHRSVTARQIERSVSVEEERTLRNDYTVMVAAMRWQIEKPELEDRYLMPSPGARITVRVYLDGSVDFFAGEQELRVTRVIERGRTRIPGQRPVEGVEPRLLIRKRLYAMAIKDNQENEREANRSKSVRPTAERS